MEFLIVSFLPVKAIENVGHGEKHSVVLTCCCPTWLLGGQVPWLGWYFVGTPFLIVQNHSS